MKHSHLLIPVLLLALLAGCASTPPTQSPDGLTESGTLTIREQQIMRMAVGGSGEGTLIYQGWQYRFRLENMTLSGIGDDSVDLRGTVYGLENIGDFEGTYTPRKAEIEAGEGLSGLWVENEKGVVVHVRSEGQDLEMQLHPTGANVMFK